MACRGSQAFPADLQRGLAALRWGGQEGSDIPLALWERLLSQKTSLTNTSLLYLYIFLAEQTSLTDAHLVC